MTKILAVCGSSFGNAHSWVMLQAAGEAAEKAGATVDYLDLRKEPLPLLGHTDAHSKNVDGIQKRVAAAEAYLIATPEYHGNMSGVTKNFLDHHYEEFAGKAFGIIVATGGSQGVSAAKTLQYAVHYCHGWTLPYIVGASGAAFTKEGQLTDDRVRNRLKNMGRDLALYGQLLQGQFQKDLQLPSDQQLGFAEWHL
jgi:FMN reductase